MNSINTKKSLLTEVNAVERQLQYFFDEFDIEAKIKGYYIEYSRLVGYPVPDWNYSDLKSFIDNVQEPYGIQLFKIRYELTKDGVTKPLTVYVTYNGNSFIQYFIEDKFTEVVDAKSDLLNGCRNLKKLINADFKLEEVYE